MGYQLIVFDVDGTLAQKYELNLMPGVAEFFRLVFKSSCQNAPQIAIATNQGGVGMRRWMELKGSGNPAKYPTQAEVEARLRSLLETLGAPPDLPVFVSYRYRTKNGYWVPVPPEGRGQPGWDESWRKPQPGMLLEAMRVTGAAPEKTLYVGDSDDDRAAALAAGCHFTPADEFFSKDWTQCEALEFALM